MLNSGDHIRVKENGLTGIIVLVSAYISKTSTKYTFDVIWNHMPNSTNSYDFASMSDAEQIWELDGGRTVQQSWHAQNPFNQRPSQGLDFIPIEIKIGDVKTACSHEWQDYTGLMTSYKFCKKCDVKQ